MAKEPRYSQDHLRLLAAVAVAIGVLVAPQASAAAPGELDTSFGARGVAEPIVDRWACGLTGCAGDEYPAVALPNGRHLFATIIGHRPALVRLDGAGRLDATFGGDGIVASGLPVGSTPGAVTSLPTGNVLLAAIDTEGDDDLHVLRFLPNGERDPRFGRNGEVEVPLTDAPDGTRNKMSAIGVLPDGRIVLAGAAWTSQPSRWIADASQYFALVRLRPEGSRDTTLGPQGVQLRPSPLVSIYRTFLLADGSALAYGLTNTLAGRRLMRYHPSGDLDASYGRNGHASLPLPENAFGSGEWVDPHTGHADVAASTVEAEDGSALPQGSTRVVTARVRADGTPAPEFGVGGLVSTIVPRNVVASQLVTQPDGKLVVALSGAIDWTAQLLRYTRVGALDPAFGGGDGFADVLQTTQVMPTALAIRSDWRLVLMGVRTGARDPGMWAARFEGDPPLPNLTIPVSVTCHSICTGSVTMLSGPFAASLRRFDTVIGRRGFSSTRARAGRVFVRVPLTPAARRMLLRQKRHAIVLRAVRRSGGRTSVTTRRVWISVDARRPYVLQR